LYVGGVGLVASPPRNTLTFVLPYKRYASTDLLQLAKRYLDEPTLSLRKATSQGPSGKPIVYADHHQGAALAHTTLARWLIFLGMMAASLAFGCELFLQAHPDSSIHRFDGPVEPRKARSNEREKILSIARRLLYLRSRWDAAFKETPFFPRFATSCRPP
jgi:hypothetical protein